MLCPCKLFFAIFASMIWFCCAIHEIRNLVNQISVKPAKLVACGVIALGSNVLPILPAVAITDNWKCSDNVAILSNRKGKDVIMVGTAHISEESAELVRRAVRDTKPDVVTIELDKKRLGKVDNSKKSLAEFGFIEPSPGVKKSLGAPINPLRISAPLQVTQAADSAESSVVLDASPVRSDSFARVNTLKQIAEYVQTTFTTTTQRVLGAIVGKKELQIYVARNRVKESIHTSVGTC